jgi:ribosomal protein S18 acetylase RimI-like enzyme
MQTTQCARLGTAGVVSRPSPLPPAPLYWASRSARRPTLTVVAATDFHQKRLSAEPEGERPAATAPLAPTLEVRIADRDDELEAAAWLRARSFYAYPPERKFAGEIHQMMVADEELKALKAARLNRILAVNSGSEEPPAERSACIVALCSAEALGEDAEGDERLLVTDDGDTWRVVVGTLDLHAVRAMPDELLIGNCENAAYLANVCAAPAARRRGVGEALLREARALARQWGVDGMYVHTLAVNEIAMRFYDRNGFVVEKEETPNQAHHRGRCLDGIEGRGRSVLLRDTRLDSEEGA